ncbi:MAG: BON domain-containing protein [Actinobacteria bacterium]|nr:BON domain-containing protein [Actinomycetota bacterium]
MATANEIESAARTAIARDSRMAGADIRIKADEIGIVSLKGEAASYDQKVAAEEVIERIKGVADIVNEISVIPRESRSDDLIASEVEDSLRRCAWVDETRFSVETVNGVVFLRGIASSQRERSEAEKDARWNAGVRDVVNEIDVRPTGKVDDQEIERDARSALIKNTRIDLTEMNMSVLNGEVRLTGRVPSFVLKRVAEYVALCISSPCPASSTLSMI